MTCEEKYKALFANTLDAMMLRRSLSIEQLQKLDCATLFCGNQSAIFHEQTQHIVV